VLGFTVAHGQIAELHLVADRAKLTHLRLSFTPGEACRAGTDVTAPRVRAVTSSIAISSLFTGTRAEQPLMLRPQSADPGDR
jgi:hypothetical protein